MQSGTAEQHLGANKVMNTKANSVSEPAQDMELLRICW